MADTPADAPLRKTPLFERHVALGAKMVGFGGWHMPVSYKTGILEEHRRVRTAAGLFDVSHMGEARLLGDGAFAALQRVVTGDVGKLQDGQALYSVMCHESGGIVDDCIVYRIKSDQYLIILNAGNIEKDLAHLRASIGTACELRDESDATGLLALQGPKALSLLAAHAVLKSGEKVADLPRNRIADASLFGRSVSIATTGYTGELGAELLCRAEDTGHLWDSLLAAGVAVDLAPIGLGARDTLRLEARLPLYGNDLDDVTTPLEAGLGWVVSFTKGDFIGRAALEAQKQAGLTRKLVSFVMRGAGIARHGYGIHAPAQGPLVGVVTSGSHSPTLNAAIGLGYVPTLLATPGAELTIDCRGRMIPAEIVSGAFYKRAAENKSAAPSAAKESV